MAASKQTAAALILCGLLVGCGSGDLTLAEVDPNAVPLDPDFELVFNIVQRDCVPCHTDAEDEEDGPQNASSLEILLTVSGGVEPDLRT